MSCCEGRNPNMIRLDQGPRHNDWQDPSAHGPEIHVPGGRYVLDLPAELYRWVPNG